MYRSNVMTFDEADDVFFTASDIDQGKPLKNNTYLQWRKNVNHPMTGEKTDAFAVRLHDTDVVTIYPDEDHGTIYELKTGGWDTRTTKDRLNKYAPVSVIQRDNLFRVGGYDDHVLFEEGMVVTATGDILKGPDKNKQRELDQAMSAVDDLVKGYVDGFCEMIENGELELPSGGDCWHCSMVTEDGESLGDATGDIDHIVSHIAEDYYVPSLLFNALKHSDYANPKFVYKSIQENERARSARTVLNKFFRDNYKREIAENLNEIRERYDGTHKPELSVA